MSLRVIDKLRTLAVYGLVMGIVSTIYLLASAAASDNDEAHEYYPAIAPGMMERIARAANEGPGVAMSVARVSRQ